MKPSHTKHLVVIAMFSALLSVLSQIAIPSPSGIPFTLQTFAVALIGVVLAQKAGLVSVGIYLLLGSIGIPVFANFKGGFQNLFQLTGGFLWGFLFLVFFCGIGTGIKNKYLGCLLSIPGLILCHLFGILQFSFISKNSFVTSFLLVSFPYIIKDVVSVILAFFVGWQIRKRLNIANLL